MHHSCPPVFWGEMALHTLLTHITQPNLQGEVGKRRSPGHSGDIGKVLLCALKRSQTPQPTR